MKKKKNFLVQNRFWATTQLYCEIVLLALQLYRKREGWKNCSEKKFVLQYHFCIAEKEAWRAEIVLQEGQVYCNKGSLAAEETVLQYSLVGSRFVLQYKLYCG